MPWEIGAFQILAKKNGSRAWTRASQPRAYFNSMISFSLTLAAWSSFWI